jgi:hypothetical protein
MARPYSSESPRFAGLYNAKMNADEHRLGRKRHPRRAAAPCTGPRMTADGRRLLEMLAGSADGSTDALLTAHGFNLDVLISIVSAEFATAQPERTLVSAKARATRSWWTAPYGRTGTRGRSRWKRPTC